MIRRVAIALIAVNAATNPVDGSTYTCSDHKKIEVSEKSGTPQHVMLPNDRFDISFSESFMYTSGIGMRRFSCSDSSRMGDVFVECIYGNSIFFLDRATLQFARSELDPSETGRSFLAIGACRIH